MENDFVNDYLKKRIKYIGEMSYVDVKLNEILNWGGFGVCDLCNSLIKNKGYLIFLLNSCICPKCFSDIKKRYKNKKVDSDDLKLQNKCQSSFYSYHLLNMR